MNIVERIEQLAVSGGFWEVWEDCDRELAFSLCNEIREKLDVPPYPQAVLNDGWHYCDIFAEDREYAMDEFVGLVFGWW